MAIMQICRDCKHFVSKAADILIQLYQTNQSSEVSLINQSLTTLLNLDIQMFLKSFFANFEEGSEIVRERALKFLSIKLPLVIAEDAMSKEVEDKLLDYSKKAMEDVTKDEFLTFVGILTKLKSAKTFTGQGMIVGVIKSQAELNKPFNPKDADYLDKFLLCIQYTFPLLSQYNRASEYIQYICTQMLPNLNLLAEKGNDLIVLQKLAEMSPLIHADDIPKVIDLAKCQEIVYKILMDFLPKPQTEVDVQKDAEAATNQDGKNQENMKQPTEEKSVSGDKPVAAQAQQQQESEVHFTHIEYLLYTFHQFGRLRPDFLSEALFKDMKPRLQSTSDGCKRYMERLSNQVRTIRFGELKKKDNEIRSIALRTTKNITIMIKDLFYKPPQFAKSSILLSCKPLAPQPPPQNKKLRLNSGAFCLASDNNV